MLKSLGLFLLSTYMGALSANQNEPVSSESIADALGGDQLTRGIVLRQRTEPVPTSIDLDIEFEFDSSRLTQGAIVQLEKLLEALKRPQFVDSLFSIVGHTDAKGNADYNLRLSFERAASVKKYLDDQGLDGNRLEVVGKGESELRYADRPNDPANRRVQVINLGPGVESR